uniref:Uncharacterized protein n=1 Tax=Helianthus annuus TaxID=4232 RepID=A0A251URY3_HELAN
MSISLQLELRKCSWLTILLLCVLMAVMLPRPSLIQYTALRLMFPVLLMGFCLLFMTGICSDYLEQFI